MTYILIALVVCLCIVVLLGAWEISDLRSRLAEQAGQFEMVVRRLDHMDMDKGTPRPARRRVTRAIKTGKKRKTR